MLVVERLGEDLPEEHAAESTLQVVVEVDSDDARVRDAPRTVGRAVASNFIFHVNNATQAAVLDNETMAAPGPRQKIADYREARSDERSPV